MYFAAHKGNLSFLSSEYGIISRNELRLYDIYRAKKDVLQTLCDCLGIVNDPKDTKALLAAKLDHHDIGDEATAIKYLKRLDASR
jgi:hypothetical protein